MNKIIPITILTGFLGSGKTTLLNTLFEKYPTKKFAIIENEVGSINIDNQLINYSKEGIFELSNGCVCCSLNDDLKKTLNKLVIQYDDFDHILIETTGIADPSIVISSILNDIHFQGIFAIDGVVALADAQHFFKMMDKEPLFKKQLAFADVILINKIDKITEEQLLKVEEAINIINPLANKEKTNYAKFQENDILNLLAYKIKVVEQQTELAVIQDQELVHHEVTSFAFTFEQDFDVQKLTNWINAILLINAGNIYRIKGILSCKGQSQRIVLQSVYTDYVMGKGSIWQNEQRISKIIFIGKNIDKIMFREGLKSCIS